MLPSAKALGYFRSFLPELLLASSLCHGNEPSAFSLACLWPVYATGRGAELGLFFDVHFEFPWQTVTLNKQ